jgi:phytoene desaturase
MAATVATTIIEARDKPGGRGYYWKDGFTFDGGPTVSHLDPPHLSELWRCRVAKMAE